MEVVGTGAGAGAGASAVGGAAGVSAEDAPGSGEEGAGGAFFRVPAQPTMINIEIRQTVRMPAPPEFPADVERCHSTALRGPVQVPR